MQEDDQIETLVRSICLACDVAPGDAFFRNRRPRFINDVIESGRQGLVSSVNAARIIAAHVGENIDDRMDAVVMSARWPRVAQSLHALWKLWGPIPQVRRCNPNLKDDMNCRQNFHGDQYFTVAHRPNALTLVLPYYSSLNLKMLISITSLSQER